MLFFFFLFPYLRLANEMKRYPRRRQASCFPMHSKLHPVHGALLSALRYIVYGLEARPRILMNDIHQVLQCLLDSGLAGGVLSTSQTLILFHKPYIHTYRSLRSSTNSSSSTWYVHNVATPGSQRQRLTRLLGFIKSTRQACQSDQGLYNLPMTRVALFYRLVCPPCLGPWTNWVSRWCHPSARRVHG